jgi:FkbH-like protein
VFVDDNPVERARVREALPMVAVPELPDDPAQYVRCLSRGGYFEATFLTDEDTQRSVQYAANAEREALRGASQSLDDFLRSLEMAVVHGPITRVDVARAAQLVNKTNQFNTTTRRSSVEELEKWIQNPTGMTLQFRLLDRFGDNGLVSVMLFAASDADGAGVLELSNWVMSCRVFGRGLEQEAMNLAVELARVRGVKMFDAPYVPTAKNAVIKDLFANLGFVRAKQDERRDSASRWILDLETYEARPTHIKRRRHS